MPDKKSASEIKKEATKKTTQPAANDKPVRNAEIKSTKKPATKKDADAQKPASTAKKTATASSVNENTTASSKTGGFASSAVAAIKDPKNRRYLIMAAVSFVLIVAIIVGSVLGLRSCNNDSPFTPVDTESYHYDRFDDNANFVKKSVDDSNWSGVKSIELTDGYEKGSSRAPQTATYVRELKPEEIVKPVAGVKDEHEKYGVVNYPSYGKNLGAVPTTEFNGMVQECRSLIPAPTWHSTNSYDAIDSQGYLLKNGERIAYSASSDAASGVESDDGDGGIVNDPNAEPGGESGEIEDGSSKASAQYNEQFRKLYVHTSAATLYGGGLSDSEPRIVKTIEYITRGGSGAIGSKQITGLYAPAGEVIKIEMSEDDFSKANGMHVYIGQNYNIDGNDGISLEWKNNADGTTTGKTTGINRMPNILSHFSYATNSPAVTRENGTVTFYVGSFWGGPVYVRPANNSVERNISVTISGAVRYQHFILGATTEDEYNANAQSTAPYFDLEIYDRAIRFTTGIAGAARLRTMTYEDCTDAAILWDKISQVSKRVAPNGLSSSDAPVNFIGDCYIAAGAAYANPGRNGVVCPPSWVADALDYNAFVNGGSWGAMHEYNHCWQSYGVGNGGEVTNNATTLVSYTLYTRISASRTAEASLGGGWNRFTDPSVSLANLLQQSNSGTEDEPQKCFDLPLYATLIHNIGQDNFIAAAHGGRESGSTPYYNNLVEATHYDMTYYFTDILNHDIGTENAKGTLTQSAVNAVQEKNYPVFVPVSSVYQVGRSIIDGNEKKYITTAQPFSYGSGEFIMDFNNRNDFKNGQFIGKGLVIPDGFTAEVVSVTQPEHGSVELLGNNYVKYTPANGGNSLYSGNFRVKLRIKKDDKRFIVEDVDLVINLKQGINTTLDRTTYVYENETDVPDTASVYDAATQTFRFGSYAETETITNVCSQETNTQIWGAGRNFYDDVFSATSTNYKELPLKKTIQTLDGVMYFSSAGTYRFTLKGRGKATLYLSYDGTNWENALTIDRNRSNGTAYVETEFKEHEFNTAQNYVYYKVVLYVKNDWQDFFGVGCSKMNTDGTFPAFANASNTITADTVAIDKLLKEEAAKKFETEYRFANEYQYTYSESTTYDAAEQKLVSVSNQGAWNDTLKIDNLFDGNSNTYYLTASNADAISEEKPFELVVDLGAIKRVNRVTFNVYQNKVGQNGQLSTFKLYGSSDGEGYSLLLEQTGLTYKNLNPVTFSFDETDVRYYKLVVTKTDNGRFGMQSIEFGYTLAYRNGTHVLPNDFHVRYIGHGWETENKLCTFGLAYTANAGNSVEFHFTGTRFAYFAYQSADYGTVDIYVDGVLIASDIDLSADKNVGSLAYMYLGEALENTDHVLKIVGKTGKFNVDSFAYWA